MRWIAMLAIAACGQPSDDREAPPLPPARPLPALPDAPPAAPVPALPDRLLSLETGREECAAVALRDATVLVIGGYEHGKPGPGHSLASVERLDLATGTVRAAAPLGRARSRHTATLLRDGRVLVIGDVAADGASEIYDPVTDRWHDVTAPPSWHRGRWGHTATLLADGRVLVAGGILAAEDRVANDVDLFDPRTERWTAGAPLLRARDEHTATLLRDGRVLIAGGRAFQPPIGSGIAYLADAEVYDPARNRWDAIAAMHSPRSQFAAALLPDGRVLVAGGYKPSVATNDAEIFDPATSTWTPTAPLAEGRFHHTASSLEVGVVVAGGWKDQTNLATTEVFDPTTSRWRAGPPLRVARDNHCAVALPTGLLLFGGQNPHHFSVREVEALPLGAFRR